MNTYLQLLEVLANSKVALVVALVIADRLRERRRSMMRGRNRSDSTVAEAHPVSASGVLP